MAEGNTGGTSGPRPISSVVDEYGDMHKLVLQGMMSAGYLDATGVKKLFMAACSYLRLDDEGRTSMFYVQKIMRDINEKIKPFDMAIKSASDELTEKKYYIFLITVHKPILKFQTMFSKFESSLTGKIIETMFHKYATFSVPFTEAMNLSSEIEARGNIDQAEKFIHRMIALNFFTKYPLGGENFSITMGVRGIRELEPILWDCYREYLAKCGLCKMILLHGFLCPQCRLVIHRACFTRYSKNLEKSSPTCPNCSFSWDDRTKMLIRNRDVEHFEYDDDLPKSKHSKHRNRRQVPSPPDLDAASDSDFIASPVDEATRRMPNLTLQDDDDDEDYRKPRSKKRGHSKSRRVDDSSKSRRSRR